MSTRSKLSRLGLVIAIAAVAAVAFGEPTLEQDNAALPSSHHPQAVPVCAADCGFAALLRGR
ncbi:MAG TPA: hypothetical protein VLA16_01245 [Ideonella sp.]|nr:hypothetical protein [Ideonella sp.]